MRFFYFIPIVLLVSACGIPPSDIALGGAVGYALYGDEIEEIPQEEMEAKLQDPKTYRDAVPPQAKDTARRVADNVRDNVRYNTRKLKEWWFYDPEKDRAKGGHVPPSYCYRVMQDIVCYEKPMPGWETRLVGYQGTLAMAPELVKTQPLPKLDKSEKRTPEEELKKADPIFTEIPEEVKKSRTDNQDISGSAQEILPDPLISPQL